MGVGRLGSDARHHGTLAGKFSIIGSSWLGPLPMFVMAELSCRRELRYHSYSAAPHRLMMIAKHRATARLTSSAVSDGAPTW
eukprot:COSAG01_NODE_502_length_16182_cov_24.914257_8_plen_82_part_00